MNAMNQRNIRKKKSSFFSRLTKRQKTTKQTSNSLHTMDRIPLNKEVATSSQKGSTSIMCVIDSAPPSLQSLSSSQSSMDTQSNHEKMQETADSSCSSKRPNSLYAPCAQNFADLDAEFMEIRADRWRGEGGPFVDLESSAQFSMSMDIDERDAAQKKEVQIHSEQQEKNETAATSKNPLDVTSDSMPLPLFSSKQKEMVEPTSFELDSSLLSELSAINLVEESFSDDESQESLDGTQSEANVEISNLEEDEELQEEEGEDVGVEDEEEHGEQASGAFHLFSCNYLQERLSCISCV